MGNRVQGSGFRVANRVSVHDIRPLFPVLNLNLNLNPRPRIGQGDPGGSGNDHSGERGASGFPLTPAATGAARRLRGWQRPIRGGMGRSQIVVSTMRLVRQRHFDVNSRILLTRSASEEH